MSKQSKTNWGRIDALRNEDIDYSDSPRLKSDFFNKAVQWPGNKELISLRVDPDVLAFFRNQGRGYQTTINILLRKYMDAQNLIGNEDELRKMAGVRVAKAGTKQRKRNQSTTGNRRRK